MATNYGVIVAAIIGREGWYRAACFSFASYVEGVSIKGTTLVVGQRVAIVQSGSWSDNRRGFAFAEIDAGIYSHIELSDTKNFIIETNPVGAALAYLIHKAGAAQELYHPARVTAVGTASLTVKDWYTDAPLGVWSLASDLDAADFSIDDGVLLRMIPDAIRRVEGWWETVPADIFLGAIFDSGDPTFSGCKLKLNRDNTLSVTLEDGLYDAGMVSPGQSEHIILIAWPPATHQVFYPTATYLSVYDTTSDTALVVNGFPVKTVQIDEPFTNPDWVKRTLLPNLFGALTNLTVVSLPKKYKRGIYMIGPNGFWLTGIQPT